MIPVRVEQFSNNHVTIYAEDGKYFQSYDSVVAKIKDGEIILYSKWDYSGTTVKHLARWLGYGDAKILRKKIKDGRIKLHEEL